MPLIQAAVNPGAGGVSVAALFLVASSWAHAHPWLTTLTGVGTTATAGFFSYRWMAERFDKRFPSNNSALAMLESTKTYTPLPASDSRWLVSSATWRFELPARRLLLELKIITLSGPSIVSSTLHDFAICLFAPNIKPSTQPIRVGAINAVFVNKKSIVRGIDEMTIRAVIDITQWFALNALRRRNCDGALWCLGVEVSGAAGEIGIPRAEACFEFDRLGPSMLDAWLNANELVGSGGGPDAPRSAGRP